MIIMLNSRMHGYIYLKINLQKNKTRKISELTHRPPKDPTVVIRGSLFLRFYFLSALARPTKN